MHENSVQQTYWRRRPGSGRYHRFIQCGFVIQVGEYLVDDQGIFDTGVDSPPSAGPAVLDVSQSVKSKQIVQSKLPARSFSTSFSISYEQENVE